MLLSPERRVLLSGEGGVHWQQHLAQHQHSKLPDIPQALQWCSGSSYDTRCTITTIQKRSSGNCWVQQQQQSLFQTPEGSSNSTFSGHREGENLSKETCRSVCKLLRAIKHNLETIVNRQATCTGQRKSGY
jgi:hypothetical protein